VLVNSGVGNTGQGTEGWMGKGKDTSLETGRETLGCG